MSTTAGVFSETTLLNIRQMADAMMFDDRTKLNFTARTDVMQSIPRLQTANVKMLEQKKDYTIEIEWVNNCSVVAQDCNDCSVGGPELSTNTQEYTITRCKEAPFSVKAYKNIDNDFDAQEIVAKGLLSADKVISEAIAVEYLDWIVTNAGTSEFTEAGEIGTVVGNEIQIAAANYTVAAIPYMLKVLDYNEFTNPLLMSGNQLYDVFQAAKFTAGTYAGDAGQKNAFNALETMWDIVNFTRAAYNDRMIGISTGAIAFASKSYYGPEIQDFGKEGKRWSVQSRFIPGLVLEIQYNTNCEYDIIGQDFNVKARYDFFLNPEGCRADNNGIVQFVEV